MLARAAKVAPLALLVALGVLHAAALARPHADQNVTEVPPSQLGGPQTVQYVRMGNCSGPLNLLYVETVVLAKDANSLINGTIEVQLDSTLAPLAIACVRVYPKTDHDRRALTAYTLLGPKGFLLEVQEQPPQQARDIQYKISVYSALPASRNVTGRGRV